MARPVAESIHSLNNLLQKMKLKKYSFRVSKLTLLGDSNNFREISKSSDHQNFTFLKAMPVAAPGETAIPS